MDDFDRKFQNLALETSVKPSCITSNRRDMAIISKDKPSSPLSHASNHQVATDDLLPSTNLSPSSKSFKILLKKELFSKDNGDTKDTNSESGAVTPKTTLASVNNSFSRATTPLSPPTMKHTENSGIEIFQSPKKTLTSPVDEIDEYLSAMKETPPLSSGKANALSLEKENESSGLKISPSTELIEPSEDDIEEFFSIMEKQIAERFAEKYNYDIINDEPLGGRYEWVPVVQNGKENVRGEMMERGA